MANKVFCEKVPTDDGQEQVYGFYFLIPALGEDGSRILIRQYNTTGTRAQISSAIDDLTSKIALIDAIPVNATPIEIPVPMPVTDDPVPVPPIPVKP